MNKGTNGKIKTNDSIFALKLRTESNGLGVLKTVIVVLLIAIQAGILVLAYLYFMSVFQWYLAFAIIMTLITCVYVLSSDFHGQAKATWILFLLTCFSFGYVIYFMSDKHILFAKSRKKFEKILKETENLQKQIDLSTLNEKEVKINCDYLFNAGKFVAHKNTKTTYYPTGTQLFDSILDELRKAQDFIFIEFFIVSNGVLLNRILDILKEKVKQNVDVRIIYDDMGSHRTLKRKTKKEIIDAGIKLQSFNKLVPVFNIALNLRDHRKIIVIDGKVAFTGGANLADEYVNEKRMHGYWKDSGIKLEGSAVDNLSIAFLSQWKFITNKNIDYKSYLNRAESFNDDVDDAVVVPFVSGPNYTFSIAQNMYANIIANAKEKLYIMTPYFIPDETLMNLIKNKARSGVDVRIFIPDIADKKFVYIVTRNNVEKLLDYGVKVYTMTHSFIHSKIILTENSAIVGSINVDLRSFNQQFESAVYTNEKSILDAVMFDFTDTIRYSKELTFEDRKRNKVSYRMLAGLFNLISPFM
ncbi:MAG: cardiolipin synthase [Clostridia bacterium]|nr:cardiolipin synthase [Clostridia bacterium]MBQ9793271.1 cardiolipin synthase [Clostridia bacterium]